jgi:uncharacterized membrane protein YbhN (UPF0104 family)
LILFFLSIQLIVAFWVFYDAQRHGYSVGRSLLWAIGVFFALIVFLPLYLFFRDRRRKATLLKEKARTPSPSTACFYCGKPYEGNPKTCPHCGQNLHLY